MPVTKYIVEYDLNYDFDSNHGNAAGFVEVAANDITGRAEVKSITLVNSAAGASGTEGYGGDVERTS